MESFHFPTQPANDFRRNCVTDTISAQYLATEFQNRSFVFDAQRKLSPDGRFLRKVKKQSTKLATIHVTGWQNFSNCVRNSYYFYVAAV
jgi:hypothetical protein